MNCAFLILYNRANKLQGKLNRFMGVTLLINLNTITELNLELYSNVFIGALFLFVKNSIGKNVKNKS